MGEPALVQHNSAIRVHSTEHNIVTFVIFTIHAVHQHIALLKRQKTKKTNRQYFLLSGAVLFPSIVVGILFRGIIFLPIRLSFGRVICGHFYGPGPRISFLERFLRPMYCTTPPPLYTWKRD